MDVIKIGNGFTIRGDDECVIGRLTDYVSAAPLVAMNRYYTNGRD